MSDSVASFDPATLAAFVSFYEPGDSVKVSTVREPKAPAVKATRQPKDPKPSKADKLAAMVKIDPTLPTAGTIDAVAFLAAVAVAGKRPTVNGSGVTINLYQGDAVRIRDEQIAIGGFVGYNAAAPHGSQLDVARAKARFIVRPVECKDHKQGTPAPSVAGYVSGAVDTLATRRADLAGREKLAVEGIATHDKGQAECLEAGDTAGAAKHAMLRGGFETSLALLRQDIATLG